jgi:hypothetical protein
MGIVFQRGKGVKNGKCIVSITENGLALSFPKPFVTRS